MKTVFFILLFAIGYINSFSQSNSINLVAACCVEGRGCKGSAYCSACKNCTGCKHCAKNGGSCGVCSIGSTRTYSPQKKSNNPSVSRNYTSNNTVAYIKGSLAYVSSGTLNLREGPNISYKILEKLKENEQVELLEVSNTWFKVKVQRTNTVGYVYSKYLKIKK